MQKWAVEGRQNNSGAVLDRVEQVEKPNQTFNKCILSDYYY